MASLSATGALLSPRTLVAQAWTARAAALAIFALVLFNANVLNDPDTYWHLAAGQWMLDRGHVLRRDVFSYTWTGRPWVSHEWLSEIAMAAAFRAGGWSGLLVLFGAAVASTFLLVAARVGRAVGWLGLALALTLVFALLGPSLLTRPHVLVLPILAAWTAELLAAREAERPPGLVMAPLMLLWANLHGSFAIGFLLMAPFALEALAEGRREPWRVIRGWGGAGLLCLAAAALTPQGPAGLLYPVDVARMATLNEIIEWRPADFSSVTPFEMALMAVLFICLSRGVKVPLFRLLLLLGLLHMGLQHTRHEVVLAIVAPLVLAGPIAEAIGRAPAASFLRFGPALAGFCLAVLALAGLRLALPATRGDDAVTPRTALEHVPEALRSRPVFNAYDFGGYLIFSGVRPYIDGRSDMYGDAFFSRFRSAELGGAAFDEIVARHHVAWTILPPDAALAGQLDHKPGWRRLWGDHYAVIHVRGDAAP